MTKKYFLQFDFWNTRINKFYYGIMDANLSNINITEICRDIIKASYNDINLDEVTIKVNAFNNIDA
jgi:hypothetical protein